MSKTAVRRRFQKEKRLRNEAEERSRTLDDRISLLMLQQIEERKLREDLYGRIDRLKSARGGFWARVKAFIFGRGVIA